MRVQDKHRRPLAWAILGGGLVLFVLFAILTLALPGETGKTDLMFNALMLLFLGAGTLLTLRVPQNLVGWSLSLFAFSGYVASAFMAYGLLAVAKSPDLPLAGLAGAIDGALGDWLSPVFFIFTFLFFPNGRLPSRNWRWFVYAVVVTQGVGLLATLLRDGPTLRVGADNPLGIPGSRELFNLFRDAASAAVVPLVFLLFLALFLRRRQATGTERQQLKWLFFTTSMMALLFVIIAVNEFTGSTWGDRYGEYIWFGLLVLMLTSIAIAVMRYRLYDIDVVINKTIVFGSLAAFITAVYVAIVVGIGRALGSSDEPSLALSIAATAIVAIAFSPVKESTQKVANRLVYGHRLSPYEVLTDLSRSVATAPGPSEVLAGVARAAGLGIKSEATAVSLRLQGSKEVHVSLPEGFDWVGRQAESLPVVHNGEELGDVRVSKAPKDPFTSQDRHLMERLASHAGLAFHNARLALELQARLDDISSQASELESSRARIVSAADDSRRRLERDITTGPRKDLLSLTDGLGEARRIVETDPETAAALLEELTREANQTLDALRELARGIYPPLLADRGLVSALESHVRKHDLSAELMVRDDVDTTRFDEAVETSVYFSCVEALSNTNGPAKVSLGLSGETLVVDLEGVFPSADTALAIEDRVQALGGSMSSSETPARLVLELPARALEAAR